jgi:predicted RNase H-like HicB family nuclease
MEVSMSDRTASEERDAFYDALENILEEAETLEEARDLAREALKEYNDSFSKAED